MVWTLLQQACNEPEPEKAEELLKTYGMTLNNGMIQQTYDERGYRYDLPPFVINPAVKYGETRVITRGQIQFKKETLTLLFRSAGLTDCKMTLTSDETVESVKKKCVAAMKIEKNIRLFFDGKELKDDKLLGNYPISSNMVVQVFLKYS